MGHLPHPPAKVRLVGRYVASLVYPTPSLLTPLADSVVGRDVERGTVLVADEGWGLVVELGVAVGDVGAGYAPLVKDLVMVSGELLLNNVRTIAELRGMRWTDIRTPTV